MEEVSSAGLLILFSYGTCARPIYVSIAHLSTATGRRGYRNISLFESLVLALLSSFFDLNQYPSVRSGSHPLKQGNQIISSVADPGSGAFLTPGSGIRYG
jgi:hypothetical protein